MPQGSIQRRKTYPGSGVASRFRALLMTHRSLEEKLEAEMKRPLPDTAVLRRLKRRKLSVKDELEGIQRLLEAMRATSKDRQVMQAI